MCQPSLTFLPGRKQASYKGRQFSGIVAYILIFHLPGCGHRCCFLSSVSLIVKF